MDKPIGPEGCPIEVTDLILTRVGRKDLRSYASSSRAFRRHAAHILLQRVTISRPSHIHALSAFIHSDLHSSGPSCIRYLSFRALSFTSGLTKGQDYHTFLNPLLDILSAASNIQTLNIMDADSFLSICRPLIGAFAALARVREVRIDIHSTELYNIRRVLQESISSPELIYLNITAQPCHRTPFFLLDSPSTKHVTELHVTNMSLDNTEQHPDEEMKAFPSIQTLVSTVTHHSFNLSREHTLRRTLRSVNICNMLARLPNLRRLYLFGYDRFRCREGAPEARDPDKWPTLDVLGSEFQALAEAKPPVRFNSLDIARFTFNDHKIDDRSADKYLPAILERYKPSFLRLKFHLEGYAQNHIAPKTFFPQNTPISHLWMTINPHHLMCESRGYDLQRLSERRYSFTSEIVDMLDRMAEPTHLVLHFEIQDADELCLKDLKDLHDVAELIITSAVRGPAIEFLSIRAGPLGHRAWKVTYVDTEQKRDLEELSSPDDFERDFLNNCGFLDI